MLLYISLFFIILFSDFTEHPLYMKNIIQFILTELWNHECILFIHRYFPSYLTVVLQASVFMSIFHKFFTLITCICLIHITGDKSIRFINFNIIDTKLDMKFIFFRYFLLLYFTHCHSKYVKGYIYFKRKKFLTKNTCYYREML